ncbi:MAG: hypothetical protein PHS60_11895 [Zavarzinia sp.]|nr:hypothetical protein [Zavarzinia sp.]
MTGQMNINFRNFTGLDLSSAVRTRPPRYKAPSFGEETLVRGAVAAASAVSNLGKVASDAIGFENAAAGSVRISGMIPGVRIRRPNPDITFTIGFTASAGAGLTIGGGAGMYVWSKFPGAEIGLYASAGAGYSTNIGAGAGDNLSVLFGPAPTLLAGDCITLSVDIGVDVLTVSGQLILNAPPVSLGMPPTVTGVWHPEVVGIGIALTAGMSVLPASVTVMPSRTWTRPVASF